MKILTTIACYYGNSHEYIREVANQLKNISDVVIFSPEQMNIDGIETEIRDKSLGKNLTFEPRKYMLDRINEYDYFLYNEDDVLIKEESLLYAISVNDDISSDDIQNNVGFLRYELDNEIPEFVDLAPYNSIHTGGNGVSDIIKYITKINDNYYFHPWNLHSGNFLLSKDQVKVLDHNNLFDVEPSITYAGMIESGASGFNHYMRKVTPIDGYEKLMTHHMSNRYIFNPVKVTTDLLDNFFKFLPEDVPVIW
tara:strand:- start:1251 stop:2006 length:756 start_codon:yes stop_codon:yes gene_type:complete